MKYTTDFKSIRDEVSPEEWQMPGALLGIFEAEYPPLERRLKPGDKLLVYTDGVTAGPDPGVRPDPIVTAAQHHRGLPIHELVPRLARDLFTQTRQNDDLTVLGLEIVGEAPPGGTSAAGG